LHLEKNQPARNSIPIKQIEPDLLKRYRWIAWIKLGSGTEYPLRYPFVLKNPETLAAAL